MKTFIPIAIFVIIIAAVAGIGYAVSKNNNDSASSNGIKMNTGSSDTSTSTTPDVSIDQLALAKALTSAGAKMYGASWCSHCKDQKKLFGDAVDSLPYVECSPNGSSAPPAEVCTAAGITGYPTWIINGKQVSGTKTLKELADLIGFKY